MSNHKLEIDFILDENVYLETKCRKLAIASGPTVLPNVAHNYLVDVSKVGNYLVDPTHVTNVGIFLDV